MALLTLLTDFGLADYYAAAVKGTVLRLAAGAQVVDISHEVAPGDVDGAAFLLAAAVPTFPPETVHLAVVDPGVGSSRRILVARTCPPSDAWLLAPDNGLLTPLLDQVPAGALRAVELVSLFLDGPGQTFHGRDRFAPVAAALLRGEPAAALGPVIADPVRLTWPAPRRGEGRLIGRVVHIDRFGNLITDLPSAWLPAARVSARVGIHSASLVAGHYAEIPPGEAALVPGSLGTLELSLGGDDLARRWRIPRGTEVSVAW